ncbi:MAG: DUF2478 domain-containing protein [Telmatospirillum sp.]|nr:DUF2478 domain-containing protein [Telmatospirillum sp.]
MNTDRFDAAAVVHTRDQDANGLLATFVAGLRARGITVLGIVQRDTPDPDGGHAQMDLIDVATGDVYPISQKLGRAATSCHLDQSGLSAASRVLRDAIGRRPALIVANRFGEQETTGKGFADEMLAAMSEGIPFLTLVDSRWVDQWQSFTGGAASLLLPTASSLERWFAGVGAPAGTPGGCVLAETVAFLRAAYGDAIDRLTVERAVIGHSFTAVKLSNGAAGSCQTPPRETITSDCCATLPKSLMLAGHLKGRPVGAFLADLWEDRAHCRALGVAVVNALAAGLWRDRPRTDWTLETGVDALRAAGLKSGEKLVMVGAFVSYIRKLKEHGADFAVLELTTAPFLEDEMVYYRPADSAPAVVPTADVLLMTGSTIVNDTMDDLLASARPDTRVLVVGPSVPMLPDVLASKGADILATIRITDPDRFLDILAEGGGAQGLFDGSAELVVITRAR